MKALSRTIRYLTVFFLLTVLIGAIVIIPGQNIVSAVEANIQETECVECPRYLQNMTDHSLRLDVDGNPHLAYGADHLYYASYPLCRRLTMILPIYLQPDIGIYLSCPSIPN